MIDHTKSNDSDDGIGPNGPDFPKVFSGDDLPNFLAIAGSIYHKSDGFYYKFVGPLASDWILDTGGMAIDHIPSNQTLTVPTDRVHVIVTELVNNGCIINNGTIGVL